MSVSASAVFLWIFVWLPVPLADDALSDILAVLT